MSNYKSNIDPFLNAQIESLGDSLYYKDSNEFLEEEINKNRK